MNGAKYFNLFNYVLNIHMIEHNCNIFMHNGAPRHRSKPVQSYRRYKNVDELDSGGNSPNSNPIESL